MVTLGAKTSQWRPFKWRPGPVPYLPYPRHFLFDSLENLTIVTNHLYDDFLRKTVK
jgi:hypothetical protein